MSTMRLNFRNRCQRPNLCLAGVSFIYNTPPRLASAISLLLHAQIRLSSTAPNNFDNIIVSIPTESSSETTPITTAENEKKQRKKKGWWKDVNNQRAFMDGIAKQLNLKSFDDWYGVTLEQVQKNGGSAMLAHYYSNSLARALRAIYPEHPWKPIESNRVERGHWTEAANQRAFFDSLASALNLKGLDDWYNVHVGEVNARGGRALLSEYYQGSLVRALRTIYPEHPWDAAKFHRAPQGYWKDIGNQRRLFDSIAAELGVTSLDGWYDVNVKEVIARGGKHVLSFYRGDPLIGALKAIYPEHAWEDWRFNRATYSSASDNERLRGFIESLSRQLKVQHLDDWYRVSSDRLRRLPRFAYIKRNGGLALVLKRVYPHHNWDVTRFSKLSKKSSQRSLRMIIDQVFQGEGE